MSQACLGIKPDNKPCTRPRNAKYGEYCYTCGRFGYRKLCLGKQNNGDNCTSKVTEGNYCGRHKNYRYVIKTFMEIEITETFLSTKEQVQEIATIDQIRNEILQYREYLLSLPLNNLESSKRDKLLIIKHPELIREWDFILNKEIDIKKITYGMTTRVFWLCPQKRHSYQKTITDRTYGTGCRECFLDSRRKHNKQDKEKVLQDHKNKPKNKSVEIGDETETFVVDLLLETKLFKSVVKIGNLGGSGDIEIIDHDDKAYFIQVKTLVLSSEDRERYTITLVDKYEDDMLIVCVDKNREYFAIIFAKDMPQCVAFSYKCGICKYKDNMYRDIKIFTDRLVELIPLSSTVNIISHKDIKKELESIDRLKNVIPFERNNTNGNTIDGYINGYKIQLKFSSFPQENRNCYLINSHKYGGRINGSQLIRCYEKDDFDFIIVEVAGTKDGDKEKYLGNFCVIPINILIEQGTIETSEQKGKLAFSICPPDFNKSHWAKQYWNNFAPLLVPRIL